MKWSGLEFINRCMLGFLLYKVQLKRPLRDGRGESTISNYHQNQK